MQRGATRRTFLRHIGVAGAALPSVLPRLARAASANEKLDIVAIGATRRGASNLRGVVDENIVALVDVDTRHLAQAAEQFPNASQWTDYRALFDRFKDFDAVVVSTPDHHHVHAGLRAMQLGKHLYCEKPLAHTVREVRAMIDVARRNKVVTQMGTQIHAEDNYRRVVEKIRSGVIGRVRDAHVWVGGSMVGGEIPAKPDPIPAHLDWSMWIGPAPMRDYHADIYHPRLWRGWWDFGGGTLSDFTCHYVDLVYWALGLRHPKTVKASGPQPDPLRPPASLTVEYQYAAGNTHPALSVTWYHGGAHESARVHERFNLPAWKGSAVLFVGESGMLISDYRKHLLLPQGKFADAADPPQTIAASLGHHVEWVRACKEGGRPLCNFDYSGVLAESMLLGLVSHRAGNAAIEYDAASGRVTNHAAANALLDKEYRAGWELQRLI